MPAKGQVTVQSLWTVSFMWPDTMEHCHFTGDSSQQKCSPEEALTCLPILPPRGLTSEFFCALAQNVSAGHIPETSPSLTPPPRYAKVCSISFNKRMKPSAATALIETLLNLRGGGVEYDQDTLYKILKDLVE